MVKLVKYKVATVLVSLAIMVFIIIAGEFIAVTIVSKNDFLMQHIVEIKSENNILDKIVILLKYDARNGLKKYFESLMDAIVEFEQWPTFINTRGLLDIIVASVEHKGSISDFKMESNGVMVTCEFLSKADVKLFMNAVKNIKYINSNFYGGYIIEGNKYKLKFFCSNKKS